MTTSPPDVIRAATEVDMQIVGNWLAEQRENGENDTLEMNWRTTQRVHRESGGVSVYIDIATGAPIAYWWGTLNSKSSIIEVRSSHRRQGIGKRIVNHLMDQSRRANEPLLLIQCAPESSERFWQHMGFTTFENKGRTYGKQILCQGRQLPKGDRPISLIVRFLTEDSKYSGAKPLAEHMPQAVQSEDGTIHLSERLAHFEPRAFGSSGDLFIEIQLEGQPPVFSEKCKRDMSMKIGVEECENGYAIERIRL